MTKSRRWFGFSLCCCLLRLVPSLRHKKTCDTNGRLCSETTLLPEHTCLAGASLDP